MNSPRTLILWSSSTASGTRNGMAGAETPSDKPHIPVLLRPLLAAVAPVSGVWLDGTFGAGGYTRGLLEAGADKVIGVDRDPLAFEMAAGWTSEYGDRLAMQPGVFSRMDEYAQGLDGVVLDLGVSSMQLDQAERGFSFMKDGPLDMRMSQEGESAADLVNTATEVQLADILFHYGEERASRRIAKAIVKARAEEPITTTLRLAEIIESCLPRPKPGQSHPATRRAVSGAYGCGTRPETRWATGRGDVPFHRRPDGQTFLSIPCGQDGSGQSLCARSGTGTAAIHAQDPQGCGAGRAGIAGKPTCTLGQAARGDTN